MLNLGRVVSNLMNQDPILMNRWRVVEVIDDDDYWLFRASSGPTLSFDSFDSHVANIGVENIAGIYRCVQYNFKCLESWCQVAVWRLNVKHVKTFKDARWVMPVFQYIHIYDIRCSNVIIFHFLQHFPSLGPGLSASASSSFSSSSASHSLPGSLQGGL